MKYIIRQLENVISRALERNKSVLLLGPRQTGKTTLVSRQKYALHINLIRPDIRQSYERDPSILAREVEALSTDLNTHPTIILDEVQKVPQILDVVQDLIDRQKAKFLLTGSSARKLRHHGHANLLPGRVLVLRLDPLCLSEYMPSCLEDCLLDGTLPGILAVEDPEDREADLASYVTTYLEEEVRAEAVVRNLGPFARFLEYAASESGRMMNAHKLSQEVGVSHTTIRSYFQILEDCLIIEPIEPITETQTRKKLIRSRKYLFFDLGVRRLAAREGKNPPKEVMGHLFEQFVGLELLRITRAAYQTAKVCFWRDPDGPEVDWVVKTTDRLIPIEAKWTTRPSTNDAGHVHTFLKEYSSTQKGFVVCRIPRPLTLSKRVTAIPWQNLDQVLASSQSR